MTVSRRDFLGSSAAAAAAVWSLSWTDRMAAQDIADIRVAQIGFRGQGSGHIKTTPNNVVALCDIDEEVLAKKAQEMQDKYKRKVDTYTDYRKLLERKDIDAVSIATPNHTHALLAVSAAQAGKHVYVEKPISHNIWEGRQMCEAAKQFNRIMQVGTQSRSSQSLMDAVKFTQSGALGKIRYAVGTCYKPRLSIGKRDKPLEIPSTVHYDLWCGPAEKKDIYRNNLHYDWHWDWNTGNGDMGNQGIHQVDIARWFLGEPTVSPRVMSIGGRVGYEDAGNTPNELIAFYDYPKAPLIFETRGLPRSLAAQKNWGDSMDNYRGSQIGVVVQCEKGYVLVPSYTRAEAFDDKGKSVQSWTSEGDALERHRKNWLSAVAANDPSRQFGPIHEGHLSTALCHMAGTSHQLGKPTPAAEIAEQIKANELLAISFDRMASQLRANGVDIDGENALTLGPWLELDTATEKYTNNDSANELRSRKQREPFLVPDLERGGTKTAAAS